MKASVGRFLPGSQSGMALLVVLAVVSILLTAALELGRRTGMFALSAANGADVLVAREKALAGVHLALAILVEDAGKTDIDSLQEGWADPEQLALAVADLGFDPDTLTLRIEDELGKLEVNALIQEYPGHDLVPEQFRIWERLLEQAGEGENPDPGAVLNALLDWLDSGEEGRITGTSGAEAGYYRRLVPPYACADGPFDHISELGLVKGIERVLPEIEPLVTVGGLADDDAGGCRFSFQGLINVNTADTRLLRALLPERLEDLAEDMDTFRRERGSEGEGFVNDLDKGWVFEVVPLSGEAKEAFGALIRYTSDLFRVCATGRCNRSAVSLEALVKRVQDRETQKWTAEIIRLEEAEPGTANPG